MKKHEVACMISAAMAITLCMISSPAVAQNSKPVKVFLLGGQSNMAGGGKTAKLKPPYSEPFQSVKIWNWGKWVPLSPKLNINKPGQFGPEVSFGHAIAKAYPGQDVRLVKYARGGTALYNDWSPEFKGAQYAGFMKTANEAFKELDSSKVKYEVSGMLWLQGESDAHENKGADYQENLTEFIAHMRAEFKTPDMPFVIARVRSHYGGKTGQAEIVREAQIKVAESDKNADWFDTDDCSMRNAGHYDAKGLLEIGKRFAATYEKVAGKVSR